METLQVRWIVCVYIYFRINSSLWKRQLISCWQYPTFPNPLVGEGAGETGVKSILFGEYNFSGLSKSLSLCKYKILPSFNISQISFTTTITHQYSWSVEMGTFKHFAGRTEIITKDHSGSRKPTTYERIYQASWITPRFLESHKTSTHGNTLPGSSFHPMTDWSAFLLELP